MNSDLLQKTYGINPEYSFKITGYQAFQEKSFIYIMIPVIESEQDELLERYQLTEQMRMLGEKYVPSFLMNKEESYISHWENRYYVLLKLELWRTERFRRPGRRLVKFHVRGMEAISQSNQLKRIGKWKELWEKRVDQLEKVWHSVVMNRPANDFEKMFVESFPYYAALTENAIQYYVDSTIDMELTRADYGTICHEKFTMNTWNDSIIWKNPFAWIVDHPSRDLAEFTRDLYFRKSQVYERPLQEFIQQYQSVYPLSGFAWRLYYARLVLPLHYFTCVENYYSSTSEQVKRKMSDQLNWYLERSEDYEGFIRNIFDVVEVPIRSMKIPVLDWLSK